MNTTLENFIYAGGSFWASVWKLPANSEFNFTDITESIQKPRQKIMKQNSKSGMNLIKQESWNKYSLDSRRS